MLDALLSGQVSSIVEELRARQEPKRGPAPSEVRGFRIRLDLHGARPPVWRRLEVPGNLMLPRLHAWGFRERYPSVTVTTLA